MAWEDWESEQKATFWNQILDLLEDEANRFRIDRRQDQITVTRARWDTPDIELRWGSPTVRNIHITIKGLRWPLTVEVSGAVWQDQDRAEGRRRQWNETSASSNSCDNPEEVRMWVREILPGIFDATSELTHVGGREAAIPSGDSPKFLVAGRPTGD